MRSKPAGCAILGGIALITAAILYLPRSVSTRPPLPPRLDQFEPLRPARSADVPLHPASGQIGVARQASGQPVAPPLEAESVPPIAAEPMPAVVSHRPAAAPETPVVSGRALAGHAALAPVSLGAGITEEPDERPKTGAIRRAGRTVAGAFSIAGRSIGGVFRRAF